MHLVKLNRLWADGPEQAIRPCSLFHTQNSHNMKWKDLPAEEVPKWLFTFSHKLSDAKEQGMSVEFLNCFFMMAKAHFVKRFTEEMSAELVKAAAFLHDPEINETMEAMAHIAATDLNMTTRLFEKSAANAGINKESLDRWLEEPLAKVYVFNPN